MLKIHVHFAFSVHFLNLFRVLSLKPDNQVPCQPLPRQFSQTDTHLFRLQSKSNMRCIWLKMRQLSLLDNAPNYLVESVIQKRFIEYDFIIIIQHANFGTKFDICTRTTCCKLFSRRALLVFAEFLKLLSSENKIRRNVK